MDNIVRKQNAKRINRMYNSVNNDLGICFTNIIVLKRALKYLQVKPLLLDVSYLLALELCCKHHDIFKFTIRLYASVLKLFE